MIQDFKYAVVLVLCLATMITSSLFAQQNVIQGAKEMNAQFLGKTKPLRELAPVASVSIEKRNLIKSNKPPATPINFLGYDGQTIVNPNALPFGDDPVRQQSVPAGRTVEPLFVTEGIDEEFTGGIRVPDVNGAKGRNEYLQTVNASSIQVFGNDGVALSAPFNANVIWGEIGLASFSDPVIQYDEVADRWLITDLSSITSILYAVSVTGDPLGAYYAYEFTSTGIVDYPKYGIVPGSYFVTVNEGPGTEPVFAINRDQMLAGEDMIDVQRIELPRIDGKFPTATPVDWNGMTPPKTDAFHVVRLKDDAWGNGNAEDIVELWSIEVDWDNPMNTTSTLTELVSQPYNADVCGSGGQTCLPQPGTNQELDAIATIIMNSSVYRNFSSHESIVLNFTVRATEDQAGIRWMELRKPDGDDWDIYQESTLAPADSLNRWMGAISINERGDICMGYAVASATKFPSLRFTGRLASDPLGTFSIEEYEIRSGAGSRDFSNRYGDYFAMSVDPLTDHFWFTGEYVKAESTWGTVVTSIALAKDTNDLTVSSLRAPSDGPDLSDTEQVQIVVTNSGINPHTAFKVGYQLEGNSFVVEDAVIDTLFSDSIYVHTFATTEDLSENGVYQFKAFVGAVVDDNRRNDTLSRGVQNLPFYDLNALGVQRNSRLICGPTDILDLVVQNFGFETVDSFQLRYVLNDTDDSTIVWRGVLQYNERTVVRLPVVDLLEGENTVDVMIVDINDGQVDEVPSSDSLSVSIEALMDAEFATLRLRFDGFPNETTWEILQGEDIILEGGPYDGLQFDTIDIDLCLDPESCYTFILRDSYGDGLASFDGRDGGYQILNGDGNVVASIIDVNFGSEEVNMFCLTGCMFNYNSNVTDASAVDASDGQIFILVTNGTGPYQHSIDGGVNFQRLGLFRNLPVGTYPIVIQDGVGCQVRDTFEVSFSSSIIDIANSVQMRVSPNPSSDGVYQLVIEGQSDRYKPIECVIYNGLGKVVTRQFIPRVGDRHEGLISLYRYDAGTYYLVTQDEGEISMLKLVKVE